MAPTGGKEGGSLPTSMMFFGAIILVMYFFMIRPQTKKAKEQKRFISAIQKGDRIVTLGGLHGKIIEMKEDTLIIESEGTRMKIERSAVSLENTKSKYPKTESTN
ncbi:MAG: preprotein translocase subunit YajC [Bacteroidetes bacterium]|nr:preprotein translocase subunit YajC [Bacteroidota bacterium]